MLQQCFAAYDSTTFFFFIIVPRIPYQKIMLGLIKPQVRNKESLFEKNFAFKHLKDSDPQAYLEQFKSIHLVRAVANLATRTALELHFFRYFVFGGYFINTRSPV